MGRTRAVYSRVALFVLGFVALYWTWTYYAQMNDQTVGYFFGQRMINQKDAAEVSWSHGVNSRSLLKKALAGPCLMIEADIIMRASDPPEPVMAHPPQTDSDITLREWLSEVKEHNKGIKLDFKSLDAVSPSLVLLEEAIGMAGRPVWINADILTGPGGLSRPLDPDGFLSAVSTLPTSTVLSLGWTSGWTAGVDNPGYSWDMVHEMEKICRRLHHPVSFPVRASLMAQSFPQLSWLLQQSDRYTLTVWTGHNEPFTLKEMLLYRKEFEMSRIYYDLPDSVRTEIATHGST